MNKRVLIISPYFPPVNAADMQRVRMSLPYFSSFGWDAEVVMVDEQYVDITKDDLLLQSVPTEIKIHRVKALSKKWTSKFGLGSIALRSLRFYRQKVNSLLKEKRFDLIYFSTTQFPVCVLGAYWKKRFKVPYVIDMQDPWHSDYYKDKPKHQQPPKYWFSYRLNKYMEPIALKKADGLISVSPAYISDLKARYPQIKDIPAATITFGAFEPDLTIAKKNNKHFNSLLNPGFTNLVYIGRGGVDMHRSISVLFKAVQQGLKEEAHIFSKLKIYFIGTSYAPAGHGKPTILPLAKEYGIEDNVIELTDRISFYHTLTTIEQADALFIAGSDDPKYTASKIYPYILSQKPLLSIFNPSSSAISILNEYGAKYTFGHDENEATNNRITDFIKQVINGTIGPPNYNKDSIEKYSAKNMTRQQCELFNLVLVN